MRLVWGVALMMGCGAGELTELEVKQEGLRREVDALTAEITELRGELQKAGIVKEGPNRKGGGPDASGADDLTADLGIQLKRSGKPPELPDLGQPERRENTKCGYRFQLKWLEPLSDKALQQAGLGKASPIRFFEGDTAYPAYSPSKKFEKTCSGAFAHKGMNLFFSPPDTNEVGSNYRIALSPDVPMKRSDGREVLWVYPGTTLTITGSAWKEEWGTFAAHVDATVLAVKQPGEQKPAEPAKLTGFGVEAEAQAGRLQLPSGAEAPSGPWTLTISAPTNGPYVVVESLIVGNDSHAAVLTSSGSKKK